MDYRLYLQEQSDKLNAAYKTARGSLIDMLEDNEKRTSLNAFIQEHVEHYNQQNNLIFPAAFFDIEKTDIDELNDSRADLCVTEKHMIGKDVKRIKNFMIIWEPRHHVILANTGVVHHLSPCELQKTMLHELGHAMHMPRLCGYFDAHRLKEDQKLNHLIESLADCISDFVEPLPPIADVQQKLLLYYHQTADEFTQQRIQNSYDLVQKQYPTQVLASRKQNGSSPSP